MNTDAAILLGLISVCATVALVLVIAWREFGRLPHILSWAVAFLLADLMWLLDLVAHLGWAVRPAGMAALSVAGFAVAMNTVGFRQRAGSRAAYRLPLGAAAGHAVIVVALFAIGAAPSTRLVPLTLFNAVMFILAMRALGGRRRGERVAQRIVELGLLALLAMDVAVLVGTMGMTAGLMSIDFARLRTAALLLLPAIMGGTGLFTIILLAADLADQARRMAATDAQTGILNRRGFEEAANALIGSARRQRYPLALIVIDVDRFKEINDRFGHPAGDRILCAVCHRIAAGIRPRDLFARIGGDEFAIILADTDFATAQLTVEMLRNNVESMALDLPEPVPVAASFGMVVLERVDQAHVLPDILRAADEALYRSKAAGRNRVTIVAGA